MRYPKTADLSVLKHRALDVSYDDFVNRILVKDGEDAEALGKQECLTNLEDAFKAADNIFVMRGGSISCCLPRAEATEENVLTLAMAEEAGNEGKEGRA